MVQIEICIGSACYVKGANQVVNDLNALITENNWQDKIELKGCFCMKVCEHHGGLGVKINGEVLQDITLANALEVIKERLSQELN